MKKEFLEKIMQDIQSLKPSNSQLDKIGEKIKHNTSLSIEDYKIINEYRLQYTIPLLHLRNYFNSRLKNFKFHTIKNQTYKNNDFIILCQRLKRMESIISKIKQGITTRITTIQDIGGLRIITNQLWEAEQIYYNLYENNKHIIKSDKNKYNYIIKPKASGYRGYHIVYQYLFKKEKDKKNYGSLKCELQIRTKLQHIWASTLEMVGYITKTDIKRGFGEQNWKTFFELVSSLICYIETKQLLPIHNNLTIQDIIDKIKNSKTEIDELKKIRIATNIFKGKYKQKTYRGDMLLILNTQNNTIDIKTINKKTLFSKEDYYLKEEIKDNEVAVLCNVAKYKQLIKTYPSFFLDTKSFLKIIDDYCIKKRKTL